MKKLILFLTAAACLAACTLFDDSAIWDKLDDHENRIVTLETLCSRMNTNINSLQSILTAWEESDFITGVTPITENGVQIGYTITFFKNKPITIYHGKNGEDGKEGESGSSPVVGVQKDADGVYYWTLNGEWLLDDDGNKIPATGKDGAPGQDGKPGADGEDGEDGAPGQDGKDGVIPQLKIEDDYWYVSYDNGTTWTRLGKATGEDGKDGASGESGKPGTDGKDGKDGDSMFQNIEITDSYVVLTLADGTQFKIPTWKAFEELTDMVSQMNSNIEALQAIVEALQDNDYITEVSPIRTEEGKEIGYIINFAKGGKVTIYHGQDGKDGQDGKPGTDGEDGQDGKPGQDGTDGHTPVIGVAKDTDGIYYWTVDGNWLLDENGNKVKAVGIDGQNGTDGTPGQDGKPGTPGQDGKPGTDGVTPQLKIENGRWFVSYDNGTTWNDLGQATGEQGPQGDPGVGGDSMFTNVDYSTSKDYVIFSLSNGTQIKVPTWSAFETLQTMVSQMNSNIEALQAIVEALQDNDYIVSVTPIYENLVEIGYIINFAKGGKVTIYHGKDGQDGKPGADGEDGAPGQDGKPGQNGTDGHTPVIGVAKDTDGIYYWTVDGNWLLDENGNKVKAVGIDGQNGTDGTPGQDGKPGTPGQDGKPGTDGVTPQLKIENGRWFVSYDNGTTWTDLGQATGEQGPQGPQGDPGVGGDSMFTDVDYSTSKDYVIFSLSNGTQIKVPTWSAFETLQTMVSQMNSNIEALQAVVTALQNNDYIVSVTPIYENLVEIGYIINFAKGGKVTIYHGKDGQDGKPGADGEDGAPGQDGKPGQNGTDGHTPVIGVAKDTDGIYYWTVDGNWLLDENGNKVKAVGIDGQNGTDGTPGQDGNPGTPGQDGKPGTDGVTPQLKIENGRWFVSYDNGTTWNDLGQATGEQGPQGPQGDPGVGGDSMFTNVDYSSSSDYVIFSLSNGAQFKVPTWAAFEALKTLVNQMNSNIDALQTIVEALQNNDYITSVNDIYENGKVIGYTINFSKSGKVTIYHGQDGKDGQNGQDGKPGQDGTNGTDGVDGKTPVIGVAKDTDGIYYWTVDGKWLTDDDGNKVKAVGTDGKDGNDGTAGENGNDGQPGTPGAPGQDGTDGKDGVTPQLKIENGLWFVSYDNGANWIELGQATGAQGPQGPQGDPGVGGDSMFTDVDYSSSSDYVIFSLSNGAQFKVPTWAAFEALKTLVNQMNSNIDALQTIVEALQNNDYITSVNDIYENGKVIGYTINFSKSGKVTIYHGQDGKDGQDGKPGQDGTDGIDGVDGKTPIIGVAKDTDGIYYWTIDGKWLTDDDGNKVKAVGTDGENGAAGTPGQNGQNGQNGVTPQLKIENGLWFVSYDNGANWTELGQATGDQGPQGSQGPQGPEGAQGNDGDSMFSKVEYDNNSVTFTLSDGTVISVPLCANGVSVRLGTVGESYAQFEGTVVNKRADFKVTVYYGTDSNVSTSNYAGKVSVTSATDGAFTLVVNKLQSEKTYYYVVETVNNGKKSYSDPDSFTTEGVTGYNNQFDITSAVNLSAEGTANSYIVTKAGTYRITPVKGNGSESVGNVNSVTVLWETYGTSNIPERGGLIEGVKYENGYIYFKTSDVYREGNVLIAAKGGNGILWSWHIWMTDQPKEQVYNNNAGTMMDRNLGATSAVPGEVGALGLMYQWGRKDPFMGSSSISTPVEAKATITFPMALNATEEVGTVEYATENPTTLIKGEKTNNWLYKLDKSLWASEKTIYDPCPPGWRIPDAGENGVWYKAIGKVQVAPNPFDKENKGVDLSGIAGEDDCIWYPATGYYGKADGKFYSTGTNASYHSVTPGSAYGTISFVIGSNYPDLYLQNITDFGGAAPARCVKDTNTGGNENVNHSQGEW